MCHDIQIIKAPSVLGITPSGVQHLPGALLANGLEQRTRTRHAVIEVLHLNHLYSTVRDTYTKCLNTAAIRDFSIRLSRYVSNTIGTGRFPLVLGGDCSILLGILPALKEKGNFGLAFLDAHADFYEPEKSTTGQVADMDLAIVTGRGPEILADINGLRPYIQDENVVHVGQRDWKETQQYGSQDIKKTAINCFDLELIWEKGMEAVADEALQCIDRMDITGFWIHFDTDVLSDEINPAVDYRLPGGLSFKETEYLIKRLLGTGKAVGMSVTIFNPLLDEDGHIAGKIAASLGRIFH